MTESNHFQRDFSPRCISHPLVESRISLVSNATGSAFCKNCGLAYSRSAGFFLRPSRFDGIRSPSVPHSILFSNMILRQKTNRPTSADHINPAFRKSAVQGLLRLSEKFSMEKTTFVRAVALMDKFLSCNPTAAEQYSIVMIITLNLACKFGESQETPLTNSRISQFFSGALGNDDVGAWEIYIIEKLDWKLDVQTAHDFANYFMWQGVVTQADATRLSHFNPNDSDYEGLLRCLDDLVTTILDLTLLDFRFYRYTPVGLALSAIALSRELLGLSPWTPDLKDTTTFSFDAIKGCLDVLRQMTATEAHQQFIQQVLTRYQVTPDKDPIHHNSRTMGERSGSGASLSAALLTPPNLSPQANPQDLEPVPVRNISIMIPPLRKSTFRRILPRQSTRLPRITLSTCLLPTGRALNRICKHRA